MAEGVGKENEDHRLVRSLGEQGTHWGRTRKPQESGMIVCQVLCKV